MQAHGVIGNQGANPVELEAVPSVSLTLAQMEGTEVSTFSITGPALPDAGALDHPCNCCLLLLPLACNASQKESKWLINRAAPLSFLVYRPAIVAPPNPEQIISKRNFDLLHGRPIDILVHVIMSTRNIHLMCALTSRCIATGVGKAIASASGHQR